MKDLIERPFWIFDMDGTLTVPMHDFQEIKRILQLPLEQPVLESIYELPLKHQKLALEQLEAWEHAIAEQAKASDDALLLLQYLQSRGVQLAVLTRNTRELAFVSLLAADMLHFFSEEFILGRYCAPPKPAADGIEKILSQWQASSEQAVMVGDDPFDILAGRNARVATVFVDRGGPRKATDTHVVRSLSELIPD